jgi:uncharacterized protein (TIGR02246 family)
LAVVSSVRARLRAACLAAVAALSVGCAVDGGLQQARDEQALRALWRGFEQAFNRGDAEAVAGFYALDADRISASGELVIGRAQIRTGYQAMLARRAADPSTAPFHAEIRVRFVTADVALLDGTWSGVRDGRELRGQFTLTAKRRGGRWLLAAGRDRGVIES